MRPYFVTWFLIIFLNLEIKSCSSSIAGQRKKDTQLNCTAIPGICPEICGDNRIQYSSTFCDLYSGSCVCDCRDTLDPSCVFTPFTPCFQDCIRKNPNPSVYLYEGGNCPTNKGGRQCACECSLRADYIETNDI